MLPQFHLQNGAHGTDSRAGPQGRGEGERMCAGVQRRTCLSYLLSSNSDTYHHGAWGAMALNVKGEVMVYGDRLWGTGCFPRN